MGRGQEGPRLGVMVVEGVSEREEEARGRGAAGRKAGMYIFGKCGNDRSVVERSL